MRPAGPLGLPCFVDLGNAKPKIDLKAFGNIKLHIKYEVSNFKNKIIGPKYAFWKILKEAFSNCNPLEF